VLVLPFPVQGHINSMLQFSKTLASKGPKVSHIITPFFYKSMEDQASCTLNVEPFFMDPEKEKWMQTLTGVASPAR